VVPSTWNAGPRDAQGRPGPYEAALVGTPVAKPDQPLEILRTVHSFDPCMACGVHVVDADEARVGPRQSHVSAMTESPEDKITLEKVYVWELPVRLTHWVVFFSILVLVTGYYIGNPFISVPGAATNHFVMGWARAVDMYASIIFVLAVLVRFYWLFAGNSYAR
jgi:hypothetical protein